MITPGPTSHHGLSTFDLLIQVQGGGNCANALTAAARLGLQPAIVSKVIMNMASCLTSELSPAWSEKVSIDGVRITLQLQCS